MNISRLKEMLDALPDSLDPSTLTDKHATELCDELKDALEEIETACHEALQRELAQTLARAAELQVRLGKTAPPPIRPPAHFTVRSEIDETDAGQGIREPREEGGSAQSFQDELAALRERTQMKRRRL